MTGGGPCCRVAGLLLGIAALMVLWWAPSWSCVGALFAACAGWLLRPPLVRELVRERQSPGRDAESAAEWALRESRLRSYFEVGLVGFAEVGGDGRIEAVNGELAAMLGTAPEQLQGRMLLDVVGEAERSMLESDLVGVLGGQQERFASLVEFPRAGGGVVRVSLAARGVISAEGSVEGLTLAVVDMTEILQVLDRLREAKVEVEAASRAKSDFLANVSHEIRTPLTAILGYSEVLNHAVAETERAAAFEVVRRNGEHLMAVLGDVLDIAKVEAGEMTVDRVEVSPARILADVLELMQPRADAKGLALRLVCAGPVPQACQTDPVRLRQILGNLVGNAIKFTEIGGVRVEVAFDQPAIGNARMFVTVSDTGIGMTAEQVERLFRAFVQADTSMSRKYGGVGLGLVIAQRFARMLGGEIHLCSEPGVGSTFRLTLDVGDLRGVPMAESFDAQLTEVRSAVPTPRSAAILPTASRSLRVLVAEDGPDNQRLIQAVLKKAGHAVTVFANGKLAVDAVAEQASAGTPFDVVIMDMQMPVMDGYTATRELRKQGSRIPVIALTAHAMAEDRQRCLDAGCCEYATKPLDRRDLLCKIEQCLGRLQADSTA
jgi:PAS domain S-box-containing protein